MRFRSESVMRVANVLGSQKICRLDSRAGICQLASGPNYTLVVRNAVHPPFQNSGIRAVQLPCPPSTTFLPDLHARTFHIQLLSVTRPACL